METTTPKINIDSNVQIQDWAKADYNQSTTPTLNQTNNAVQSNQTQSLAITPESLKSVPQLKLPNIQQPTASAGVIAASQPSFATAEQNFNNTQAVVGNEAAQEQKNLMGWAWDLIGKKTDAQANQVELEKQAGIVEQQKVLGEINTEMATQQIALRGEMDRIRNQEGTISQKQISENTLNDTYGRRLADLAIRQAAANTNITAIQSNAERQTKLLTAPLDTKLEYLSTFGKDNVNFLSNEEKTKLAFITDDIKAQKASIEELQKAKANAIAEVSQNGGGTDQAVMKAIQSATDVTGVTAAGAKYIGLMDRQVKQANIAQSRASTARIYQDMAKTNAETQAAKNGFKQLSFEENAKLNSTPEAKNINDGAKFYNSLAEYKEMIKKHGTGEWTGLGSGELNSAYQAVVGSIKDYYTLGTLDDGVQKLVGLGIPKPGVWGFKATRIGGIDKQIDLLQTNITQSAQQLSKTGFANTVEGQGIIGKATAIIETRNLEKQSNDSLLNSLPSSVNSTSALDNNSFFNR